MQDPNIETGRNPDRKLGGIIVGGLALIAVIAVALTWLGPSMNTASNVPAGTTTGQGSTPTPKSTKAPTAPSR